MKETIQSLFLPPVFAVHAIDKVRLFFQRLSRKLLPPGLTVFEMVQQFVVSKAISAAAELDIADALQDGPKDIQQLAKITKTHPDSLYRVMRLLAGYNIFKEKPHKTFCNTSFSKAMAEGPGSVKNMIIAHSYERMWNILGEMKYSIQTGKCASKKLYDTYGFDFLTDNPAHDTVFNMAMSETSGLSAAALLAAYDFSGYDTVVDVGGGRGYLLCLIAQKHRHLKGVVFDQPHVVKGVPETCERFGVCARIQGIGGNFFKSVPAGGDAYILKNVLHDWDDEACMQICRNIHAVMRPTNRLLVLECIVEGDDRPSMGKLMDVMLLLLTEGGRERTRGEFSRILDMSGFRIQKIVPSVAPFSVIEAVKK